MMEPQLPPPRHRPHHSGVYGVLGVLGLLAGAPLAQAADALNGKSLYLNGPPGGGVSCSACHSASPANNVSSVLRGANNPAAISNAIALNKGGMGGLYNNRFSAAQIADLAAFLGDPNVTAAPLASLTPASLSYGGTTVGQSGAALGATLANTGSAPLNVGSIALGGAAAADYSVSGGSCASGAALAAGASCTVLVTFRPGAAGTRAATLNIGHNATGGASSVALSGSGNAVPLASVSVSAGSVDFGALPINTASTTRTISVSNSGQASLVFSAIAVGGPNAGLFTLGGSCATAQPLAAGASCSVTVQARPSAAGAFSASLNLASNAANGSAAIALSGSGAAPLAALGASPAALAFGARAIGTPASSQSVTLSNTGNTVLSFTSFAISGSASVAIGAGNGCGATLAVGASCSVPLLFAPSAAGPVAATLLVRSNAADLRVAVSGAGTTAAVGEAALSDSGAIAFPDTTVGATSAAHRSTLSNRGSAALTIAALTLGGAQPGEFALGGSCAANTTLSPSASCTIDSTFTPSAAGARGADLVLLIDGGTQLNLRLGGNGVAVAAAAALEIAPQSFDFGAAGVGAAAASTRFVLSNTGSAAATLSGASFSGPFALAAKAATDTDACPALPFVLQPGASCALLVRFTPQAAGNASGSLLLASAEGNRSVALAGQGSAAAPPTQPQNLGGGGCSAARDGNDPVLALLVLLSLGVLGWRRRTHRRPSLTS